MELFTSNNFYNSQHHFLRKLVVVSTSLSKKYKNILIFTKRIPFMEKIQYSPIGVIHSPFKKPEGTPIQPTADKDIEGTVEVLPDYEEGLKDIDGFSHIILIYHFHLSKKPKLLVKPFLDNKLRGLFSTRAPSRPNSIGISIVRLVKIEGRKLHVRGVDILDGTPLLDIKPYVPHFDERKVEKIGWLKGKIGEIPGKKADGRFT